MTQAQQPETLFEELKRYVGFGPDDERVLRSIHSVLVGDFTRIADLFYRRILDHAEARKALEGGESTVGRLKITLVAWMDKLLRGPWDEEYFDLRCRIGRVHVRIALPQHYMFGAMNVMRSEIGAVVDRHHHARPTELTAARTALDKILDLELAIMLHTFREDLVAQQARHERLATFGQLVGSIGHELRNPLGVIESSLFILKGRVGEDARVTKHIERIGEQLGIANNIVAALLDMIRDRPLKPEPLRIQAVLESALSSLSRPPEVQLIVEGIAELPELAADPTQLRQVFVNLIDNAFFAAGGAAAAAAGAVGEVKIRGMRLGEVIEISVEDSGPGVDAETRRRLFEPLVTTKTKGIGLGLALIKRIIERHGGTVGYEPSSRGGARFVVRFPIPEAEHA